MNQPPSIPDRDFNINSDLSAPFPKIIAQWFNLTSFGAVLMNLDCRFIKVNPAFILLLGYDENDLIHMNMSALVHPDELLHCMHLFSQLAEETIDSFQVDIRWVHYTGEMVWCSTQAMLIRNEQGRPQYILLQTQDQTEKKKLGNALQTSLHTFTSLIESVPYSLIIIDLDWKFTFLNKAAEQMLGTERQYLIGHSIWTLFARSLKTSFYQQIYRAMEEKVPTYLHDYYEPLGRWFEMNVHPTRDGLCMFLRDTTEIKQQETAYWETKLLLDSMIKESPDPISILDLQYNMIQMNPAYIEAFGYAEEELLGKCPVSIPEELIKETQELYHQASKGLQIKRFETQRRHKNGRLLDVSLAISPVKNSQDIVIAICIILKDISENKRMETNLRQSEEKYRIITENTTDIIALLDVDGFIRYASPSHQTILGLPPEVLFGYQPYEQWAEPFRAEMKDFFQKMVLSKKPSTKEVYWPHPNGSTLILDIRAVPVTGLDGQVETVVVISRDISERKSSEELMRRSDKLSVAGQLAAGIAHEIRNPLTALKGFTQFMQKNAQFKEEYLSIMMAELIRIEQIISELLMLAKPQSAHYRKCLIAPIIRDVVSLLESQANLRSIQIEVDITTKLPEVYCEENQVKQVFINLIKNAMDAMPAGGRIHISTREATEAMLSISFTDTGQGIAPEQLNRLGEPFFTTKESGSGLGLMVSQKMLNEHGGSLHFTSELGRGTTVTVKLPTHRIEIQGD